MSSEIYFNNQKVLSAITSYNELSNASKPTIESVILEGNRTARELNLMTRNEITQIIAQSRIPAVLPNYPATPVTGVVYYIGTSAPYNVCLYAVNDVGGLERVDLGTTNIDISSKQDKVDNSLLTTSKNIVGAINENKTNIDLKQNKVDDSLITTNKNIVSAINEIETDINAIPNTYAPLQIQRSTRSATLDGGISRDANTCIWNMKNTGLGNNVRVTEEKIFANAYLVDPIGGKWMWGTLKVLQICSTTQNVGLVIYQTLIASYFNDAVVSAPVIFKRMGFASDCTDSSQIESATITWNAWIPIEYPVGISLPLNSTSVSNQGLTAWGGNANITGGMLKITYNGLMITQNPVNNLAITSLSKFVLKQDYAIGFLNGIDNNKSCYMWAKSDNLVANKLETNIRYYGQIVIPLGY